MKREIITNVVVAVASVASAIAFHTAMSLKSELKAIDDGFSNLKDKVNINVPSDVANKLVTSACASVADEVVRNVTREARNKAEVDITIKVRDAIKEATSDVSEKVEKRLKEQIDLVSIDEIKDSVRDKVARMIYNDTKVTIHKNDISKDTIVKMCLEQGKESYEIGQILRAMKY